MLKLGFHYVSLTLIHFLHRIGIVVHSFYSIQTLTMLTVSVVCRHQLVLKGAEVSLCGFMSFCNTDKLCILRILI